MYHLVNFVCSMQVCTYSMHYNCCISVNVNAYVDAYMYMCRYVRVCLCVCMTECLFMYARVEAKSL